MLVLINIFKLNAILTVEMVALMFAVLVLVYVKKQDVSKWYNYLAKAIIVIMALIVLCTVFNAMTKCCSERKGMKEGCAKGQFEQRHHGFHRSHCQKPCCAKEGMDEGHKCKQKMDSTATDVSEDTMPEEK